MQLFRDFAILTHIVRTEIATNQGQETLSERETIVFHRRDGRWVAVHEHLSPRPDVAE
jgi:ketosteroid isomerase-like protein